MISNPLTRYRWIGLLAGAAFAALPAPTHAQETRTHDFPQLERQTGVMQYIKGGLKLSNRFIGDADFGAFEASSVQPEARLKLTAPVSQNIGVQFLGTGRLILYDFDGDTDLEGGGPRPDAPFGNLYGWDFRLQSAYLLDERHTLLSERERWSLIGEFFNKARWEEDSRVSDGMRWGGSLAVGYRLPKRLSLAVGVSMQSRWLRSGISVSPVLEFDWRINDDWVLRSFGAGLELDRILTKKVILFVRSRYERGRYRLGERDGPASKGAIQIRQVPTGAGIRWRPLPFLRVMLAAGAIPYQQLKVRNEDNDVIGKADAKASPYVMLRIDVRR